MSTRLSGSFTRACSLPGCPGKMKQVVLRGALTLLSSAPNLRVPNRSVNRMELMTATSSAGSGTSLALSHYRGSWVGWFDSPPYPVRWSLAGFLGLYYVKIWREEKGGRIGGAGIEAWGWRFLRNLERKEKKKVLE